MLKKFAVICTLMLCVLVAGCSDDQTATVIPQPETKQTQNNKNQEITVTVYRAPVNGEEYLLPEKVTRKAGAMTAPEIALDILVNSSPQDTAKMVSLFPKGTKIRTMKIEDGTAYVDFSKEITNVPQARCLVRRAIRSDKTIAFDEFPTGTRLPGSMTTKL